MSRGELSEQASAHEYPAGHLHHLSASQIKALEDFKAICEEEGCYKPGNKSEQPSHDDETLLRFSRARRFVPGDALAQFQATEDWRKEQDIENWYNTIDIDEYEATRVLYTHWTGRRDKMGIPLYVFNIGGLDSKKLSETETFTKSEAHGGLSPKLRRLFATYEHLTNFVFPLCSSVPSRKHPETPISQTCNIVDISGVSIRQFWSLKKHLQDAGALATAHYPETLGKTFIVGAPSFFPTVWNWIKQWFDPITVSTIFILSEAQVKPTLEKFVDSSEIPKRYGGTLDWEFGDLPLIDSELLGLMNMEDGIPTILPGPIRWRKSADGTRVEAHALGSSSGQQRDEVIAHMPSEVFSKSLFVLE
ncbi:hypothetical protein M409DRAFT_19215 [Zasmidium cellare ATCC 36951]|uniref:CRAL-TRIO domain-containing protein n=1 Tax=Zasmidium cellare ATCC 36951 TaxID=1080233 RepID=A0A6A6CX20_ZASCE|nr:uncharacterized protein M409DRAFT_19215 [Zasmidium cellare ATCC 36951]KAF2170392.1 hypothetical protein M409DRAFT_19215 [Zasmidium cellare ATCC 36951]